MKTVYFSLTSEKHLMRKLSFYGINRTLSTTQYEFSPRGMKYNKEKCVDNNSQSETRTLHSCFRWDQVSLIHIPRGFCLVLIFSLYEVFHVHLKTCENPTWIDFRPSSYTFT